MVYLNPESLILGVKIYGRLPCTSTSLFLRSLPRFPLSLFFEDPYTNCALYTLECKVPQGRHDCVFYTLKYLTILKLLDIYLVQFNVHKYKR